MILTTHTGRRLTVDEQVHADTGRVIYRVAGVGAFTISRESWAWPEREAGLQVEYGAKPGAGFHSGYEPLPEAPVLFASITLVGATVFRDSSIDPEHPHGWLTARRATGPRTCESVPAATRKRVAEIVAALALHHLARPDLHEIEHAQDLLLAETRLGEQRRHIERLRDEIAEREAALALALARADLQANLLREAVACP